VERRPGAGVDRQVNCRDAQAVHVAIARAAPEPTRGSRTAASEWGSRGQQAPEPTRSGWRGHGGRRWSGLWSAAECAAGCTNQGNAGAVRPSIVHRASTVHPPRGASRRCSPQRVELPRGRSGTPCGASDPNVLRRLLPHRAVSSTEVAGPADRTLI
jgi:hypothetical protein